MSSYGMMNHFDSIQPDAGLPLKNSFGVASVDNQRRLTESGMTYGAGHYVFEGMR